MRSQLYANKRFTKITEIFLFLSTFFFLVQLEKSY